MDEASGMIGMIDMTELEQLSFSEDETIHI